MAVVSEYMHWAKTRSHARYSLAYSGVNQMKIEEFPLAPGDVELWANAPYGYEPLKQAIAQHVGVPLESVVTEMGTTMANHLAMAALVEPGDEVLIEQPAYEPLLALARYFQAEIRRFPRRYEDRYAVDVEALKRAVTARTRVIAITNLHNPSSALVDEATLRQIGEIARGVGARVLVDEVYLPAAGAKAPATALRLGSEFVVTSSLTKMYGLSGLRCGWLLAEPELAERMWLLTDIFAGVGPHPAQRLSVAAFRNLPAIEARARGILTANRAVLEKFLASRDDLECFDPGFGTVVFPRLKSGEVEHLATVLREKYETTIVPGRFFESPQHFRLGMGAPPEEFREGMARLGRALDGN